MGLICIHGFVSGRVQGVFFRRNTYEQALKWGLTGWVQNKSDGRVEVFVCGEQIAVEALRDWLWEGPAGANVTAVDVQEVPVQKHTQFEVR